MTLSVKPGETVNRDGGSFQECRMDGNSILKEYGRYCTIRDNEQAPPTKQSGRRWVQIYRTPDNTE